MCTHAATIPPLFLSVHTASLPAREATPAYRQDAGGAGLARGVFAAREATPVYRQGARVRGRLAARLR